MYNFFAHSANRAGSAWEPLGKHIEDVATRAAEYADFFGAKEEAIISGLWHDLGKYSELFVKRLEGKESGLDHWSAGTIATLSVFKEKALGAALAIQGHHIGLQEGSRPEIHASCNISTLSQPNTHPLELKLTTADWKELLECFKRDRFELPASPERSLYNFGEKTAAAMLDARMLFSALVDADYIETEAHFEGTSDGTKVYRPVGNTLQAVKAFKIVINHLDELTDNTTASDNVIKIRKALLTSCIKKAKTDPGIFTLTAPTGAGKTLAMLAFALQHSIKNPQMRRIVVVLPFLNIIEQSARVYRELLEPHFGSKYILEDHSLAGIKKINENGVQDNEQEVNRVSHLLAQNWDAPLILTTSVQLFESLFANRPAKCRKLHRLANSIILFDEVQTLPTRIVIPSLAALSRLSERYGVSVIFSTATQPAFDHLHEKVKKYTNVGWIPTPIVEKPIHLFELANRVTIDWQVKESRSWDSIAQELATHENIQSLCIVNLKRHAQKLITKLREQINDEGLFHLSTNMCPAHRQKVLDEVRDRLSSSKTKPCRLVSTQCIEAGVDVDFPVAWRALGPLDAIVQAAGRCNREGKLKGKGRMVVFLPEKENENEFLYPPGGYKGATETTKTLLSIIENETKQSGANPGKAFDIFSPDLFNRYYKLLYDLSGATDIPEDLEDAIQRRSFVSVAKLYRLIDQDSISILVPYLEQITLFNSLKIRLNDSGRLTREWIQEARPLTINLYRPNVGNIVWNYLLPAPLGHGGQADDWFIYLNPDDYDQLLGLTPPDEVKAWMI